jgi:uncharacterized spore protein YtfJ
MDFEEFVTEAREVLTVRRVFGEPFEKDGMTVIPVARVRGGAGGGGGEGPDGTGKGSGSGMALSAGPVGVYVIHGDELRWQPALDLNRAIAGGQLVAIVALLTIRAVVRARSKRKGNS